MVLSKLTAMNDETIYSIADAVVLAELVLPLVLGGPFLFSERLQERLTPARRRATKAARSNNGESASRTPALVPLVCPSCRASVALEADAFPCPHCGAEVRPPPEYVAALADRQGALRELARAERIWRWSRWTSSRPLLILLRIAIVVWLLAVCFSALVLSETWPGPVLGLAGILAVLFLIVGLSFVSALADERAKLPLLPKSEAFHCAAETGDCNTCGAPIQFPENRLATLCPYCRSESYRAALAEVERREATAKRAAASESLLDAVNALDARRSDVLVFIVFLAFAEVFYAVIFGLGWAWDSIMG